MTSQDNGDPKDQHHSSTKLPVAIGTAVVGAAAAAAGLVNPIAAIIAGALAPAVTEKVQEVIRDRAAKFREVMEREGVSLDKLERDEISSIQIDLLRESIDVILRTDSQEKMTIISRLLRTGLETPSDAEAMAAKRFARTVGRLDELEFRVLLAFRAKDGKYSDLNLQDAKANCNIASDDLVRTALSILASEGLVRELGYNIERWALTDFGRRFVVQLGLLYGGE